MNWFATPKSILKSITPELRPGRKIKSCLRHLHLEFDAKELKYLQSNKKLLLIANRPIGNIEELVMEKLSFIAGKNFSYQQNDYLAEKKIELQFLAKKTFKTESNDTLPVLFPAGTISQFQAPNKSFADSKWDKKLLHSIFEDGSDVVPIYLKIKGNVLAEWLGMMHPAMRALYIVRNLENEQSVKVKVKIGKPIQHKEKSAFFNANQFGRFLRARLYALGSALNVKDFYLESENPSAIQPAISQERLRSEIDQIRISNRLAAQGNYELFLAKAKKIPNIMQEIGRLRELTFRTVGEGTNKATDLDEYDLYYLHLFIWDKKAEKLVGAYRIGDGNYIMQSLGKKGFYLRSLFKIDDAMNDVLRQSVELGRSFVVPEYQQQRLPLFLLWQGIYLFLQREKKYNYLIGPVSISGTYSKVSLSLMEHFVKTHHYDEEMAKWVKPRKAFQPDFKKIDHECLLENISSDAKKLDALISDIEPGKDKMPVLLKKYFAQNAHIIGFNVDPDFNNTLDGFMVCKIKALPEEIKNRFDLAQN